MAISPIRRRNRPDVYIPGKESVLFLAKMNKELLFKRAELYGTDKGEHAVLIRDFVSYIKKLDEPCSGCPLCKK